MEGYFTVSVMQSYENGFIFKDTRILSSVLKAMRVLQFSINIYLEFPYNRIHQCLVLKESVHLNIKRVYHCLQTLQQMKYKVNKL